MNLIDLLKKLKNKIRFGKKQKLIESPKIKEDDILNNSKLENIINNMPQGLSKIEKAYYIYLELGKLANENAEFVFNSREYKEEHYNDPTNEKYEGVCKSLSELYVKILKDKRVGIEAETVEKNPESPLSHVDTILRIDGKKYIANLIADLGRIKTSRRTNSFCFDLSHPTGKRAVDIDRADYLHRLEQKYGKIDSLSREEIEKLDEKMGYSFFIPKSRDRDKRGVYTEDTIQKLKEELDNPELFKKYVLHDKDVPEKDHLRYKMDFIFENIHNLTDYNANLRYLENIRYYIYVINKLFSKEERDRITAYVATANNDFSNIISIIKVKGMDTNDPKENFYYIYSNAEKKYIRKEPKDVKEYISSFDKDSLKIIGTFDKYSPRNINELELGD